MDKQSEKTCDFLEWSNSRNGWAITDALDGANYGYCASGTDITACVAGSWKDWDGQGYVDIPSATARICSTTSNPTLNPSNAPSKNPSTNPTSVPSVPPTILQNCVTVFNAQH